MDTMARREDGQAIDSRGYQVVWHEWIITSRIKAFETATDDRAMQLYNLATSSIAARLDLEDRGIRLGVKSRDRDSPDDTHQFMAGDQMYTVHRKEFPFFFEAQELLPNPLDHPRSEENPIGADLMNAVMNSAHDSLSLLAGFH